MPGNQDFSSGCGITPFARVLGTCNKTTKAGNFYWFTSSQRGFDDLELPSTALVTSSLETCAFSQIRVIISAFVIDLLGLAMQ